MVGTEAAETGTGRRRALVAVAAVMVVVMAAGAMVWTAQRVEAPSQMEVVASVDVGEVAATQAPTPPMLRVPTPAPASSTSSPSTSPPKDATDYCASAPRGLANAVHAWIDAVQRPALQTPNEKEWQYFYVSKDIHCGGFADRMRGVMAAFLIALATNRAFGIQWTFPTVLTNDLTSNVVPWHEAPPPDTSRSDTALHNCDGIPNLACGFPPNARVELLATNMPWVERLLAVPDFLAALSSKGISLPWTRSAANITHLVVSDDAFANMFPCLFGMLFKVTGAAARELEALERESRGAPLACAQLRMGKGQERGWKDTESFLLTENLERAARVVVSDVVGALAQRRLLTQAPPRLFITSDATTSLAFVRDFVGAHAPHVRLIASVDDLARASFHATEAPPELLAMAESVIVAHFLMLRHCDAIVVTERSGFGRLGTWLNVGTAYSSREDVRRTAIVLMRGTAEVQSFLPESRWSRAWEGPPSTVL